MSLTCKCCGEVVCIHFEAASRSIATARIEELEAEVARLTAALNASESAEGWNVWIELQAEVERLTAKMERMRDALLLCRPAFTLRTVAGQAIMAALDAAGKVPD
ncbi:MAG: hypothetical protein V4641_09930 [Pseudomonadota bacterium]